MTLGYRKTNFWKSWKWMELKKSDIYSTDNEDDILLQLKTWVLNEEKYKTLFKTNDDIEEIFKPFLIQHNKNEKSFLIGFYKKVPRLNEIQLIIDKTHIMGKKVTFHDVLLLIWFLRLWITTGRICTENVKKLWSNDMNAKLIKNTRKSKEL